MSKNVTDSKCVIDYDGFIPDKCNIQVDRVDANLSPKEFYEQFVSKRKPVIITGLLKATDELKTIQWTNAFLTEKAGQCNVLVEKLDKNAEQKYGVEVAKVSMKYKDFLDCMNNKDDRCYMTTQDLEKDRTDLDDCGVPESLYAEPLNFLENDFPVRLRLAGNLVTHQISLWQGFTKEGSSSGLHHDFHDNFYILIRGKKRFRLFPPSSVEHVKTAGKPLKVFKNGLIAYERKHKPGVVFVRSDGLSLLYLARKRRNRAIREVSRTEQALSRLESSTLRFSLSEDERKKKIEELKIEIEKWDKELDKSLEEMLVYNESDDESDDYDDSDDEIDDSRDSDVVSIHDGEYNEKNDDEDDVTVESVKPSDVNQSEAIPVDDDSEKTKEIAGNLKRPHISEKEDSASDDDIQFIQPPAKKPKKSLEDELDTKCHLPDHFCQIKLPVQSDDSTEILNAIGAENIDMRYLVANLEAGDSLYLPASWFHEVTSYSTDCSSSEESADSSSELQDHLALNYWFYPPDGCSFENPYADEFWKERLEAILESGRSTSAEKRKKRAANDDVIYINSDDSGDEIGDTDSDEAEGISSHSCNPGSRRDSEVILDEDSSNI